MPDLVEATYIGPFAAELATGQTVRHGDRATVTVRTLQESEHWAPVSAPAAPVAPAPVAATSEKTKD